MTKKNKSNEKPFQYPAQEENLKGFLLIDDTLEYNGVKYTTPLLFCD